MKHQHISESALSEVVDAFYARVREDELLGPIFNLAVNDWAEHLERLKAFWSSVFLSSGRYKGQPLAAHIRHQDAVTPAAFDRWLALWAETTDRLLEPDAATALQERAHRIAESLSLGIRFHRDRGHGSLAPVAGQI